jgi:pyruvate dehydrogenase E2 component (dihydrolipoamide acetyltransferase)
MKIDVVMPKMGESLQEGTILKWLKNVGDKVERDEMILEISTDKVDTEIPSPVAGIIVEILAKENETIEVGKVIAYIETEETGFKTSPVKEHKQKEVKSDIPQPKPMPLPKEPITESVSGKNLIDVVMPKMGESLQEGTVLKWLKTIGDKVERDEMLLEISTDKVDTEIPSPVSGTIAELLAKENETVEVGKVIARISIAGTVVAQPPHIKVQVQLKTESVRASAAEVKPPQIKAGSGTKEIPRVSGKKFYSPLVRSIAEKEEITLEELETIQGKGIDGRVTKNDVIQYLEARKKDKVQISKETSIQTEQKLKTEPKEGSVFVGDDEIIPMDRVRQLIADHMVYSKQTSPHVTSVGEADVTEIVKFRNKHKDEFLEKEGFKLTYTPFFALATIEGIKEYPMVNVSVDGKNIIRHTKINLGIATALKEGNLIVPVVRNAEALSLAGLARSIYDLSSRARIKKLNPDDIQGGTISITNFGTFGSLFGTPIINQPQTAIIGIGAIQKRPVVKEVNGEFLIAIRDMAFMSITFDHRVIDGMLAGLCLEAIIKSLENMNEKTLII